MTSSTSELNTPPGTKRVPRNLPPADFSKVRPFRSVGFKIFGYMAVPSALCLLVLSFPLFNFSREETKARLETAALRKEAELKELSPKLITESATLSATYDQLIEQSISLENALDRGSGLSAAQVALLQELQTVRNSPIFQDVFTDRGGAVSFVDLKNPNKPLYGDSNPANLTQVSFATIPQLNRIVNWVQDTKTDTGTRSLEGKIWAYHKISNTDWAIITQMPESAAFSQAWRTFALSLLLVSGVVVVLAWLSMIDFRKKLQPLISASELLEKGGTPNLTIEENGDEINQVLQAFLRVTQFFSLQKERIKEELSESIRLEERLVLRQDKDQEAEFLESEIGGLLDVVSALEDGDLTIQAEVSDRATGLVADTLNRLREQLAEIIAGVLAAAQQVADGAGGLEVAARTVSENVENQAQSVAKGRALTEQVAALAKNSTLMVGQSSMALQTVEATIGQGQGAINSLTDSITVLQEGTAQIIQRMKTLGEFVGLAEQFVQDQGQIASLTQVLAINATLVAARAAEQRDPKQFIGVAREFEAIAGQVNTLATQTNDGLGVLQQRTAQIQSVVSAIDVEVQGLGRLVEGFTQGVEKSQKAFYQVQAVTEQVVETGQKVSSSSNEIATAAESTASYISEIATLAEQTADLTADARTQAERMGELAQRLLAGIRYFRLPDKTLPGQPS